MQNITNIYFDRICKEKFLINDPEAMIGRAKDVIQELQEQLDQYLSSESELDEEEKEVLTADTKDLINEIKKEYKNQNDVIGLSYHPMADFYVLDSTENTYDNVKDYYKEWREDTMSAETDLRLVTTMKGYKEFQKEMKNQIQEESNLRFVFENIPIKEKCKDIVYLGWNGISYDEFCAIEEITLQLRERGHSYRMATLGESATDIEETIYTNPKDKDRYIPSPCIKKEFNETEMKQQLKDYSKDFEKAKDNEMEAD